MNMDTMRDLVAQVQLDRLETAERLKQCDLVLENLQGLYPELFETPVAGALSLGPSKVASQSAREVVEMTMRDQVPPGGWLTPRELTESLLRNGWKPPDDTPDAVGIIRTTMARTDALESRQRDGRTKEYRWRRLDQSPPLTAAFRATAAMTSSALETAEMRHTAEETANSGSRSR